MDRKLIVLGVVAVICAVMVISGCTSGPASHTVTPNVTVKPMPTKTTPMTNVSDVSAYGMANNTSAAASPIVVSVTPAPMGVIQGQNNTTGIIGTGNATGIPTMNPAGIVGTSQNNTTAK
jgi:PBP1b-binding outer membrane lipoprotein LpoB